MSLIRGQREVSDRRGMPVDDKGTSTQVVAITAEAVQFYYYSAGVQTIDAGQAIGVTVVGKFFKDNIRNELGIFQARFSDTSLVFTSTDLTTEVRLPLGAIQMDYDLPSDRAAAITADFADGEYAVDYSMGIIYGKKAGTGVSISADYKVPASVTGGTDVSALAVESGGNLDVIAGGGVTKLTDDSVALEDHTISKSSPGDIYSFTGYNDNALPQFIQLHDSATLPVNGAVPVVTFEIAAKSNFTWTESTGRAMVNGITICNSTTLATKTIGVSDLWLNVTYV